MIEQLGKENWPNQVDMEGVHVERRGVGFHWTINKEAEITIEQHSGYKNRLFRRNCVNKSTTT